MTANTKNNLTIIAILTISYSFLAIAMAHNLGYW